MTLIPHNHREFEVFRLIFQRAPEKAPAAVQATETTKKPEPLSRDQAWEKIEARHGKESYESMIKTYLDKLLPKRLPKYKSALRNSSVDRYVKRLGEIRKEFWRESAEITEAKEQAKESIKAGISEELDVLRSGVEGARKRTKISNRIPEAKEQAKVQSYFNDYMEALNGRYFNVDVAFGKIAPQSVTPLVPVSRERIQAQQYKKKARDFQGRLSEWVNNKLDWLYETGEPNAKDLAAFRKEIGQRYYFLSTVADKNPDVITMADMEAVERMGAPMNAKEAKKNLELIAHDESGLASQMHLEAYHLMQPEEWEDRSRTLANSVAIDAKHNGLEDEFVSAVSTYIESSSSFDQAAGNFEAKVAETSKAGIVETHAILKKVNDATHKELLEIRNDIKPPSLRVQVGKQFDYLHGLELDEKGTPDTILVLVKFMKSGREGREAILDNARERDKLFRGIRETTEVYPKIVSGRRVPSEVKKLRRAADIEMPTSHDQTAQLKALVIAGQSAELIVQNLNKSKKYQAENFGEAIESASVEKDPKKIIYGAKINGPRTKRARVTSALERGGFTARNMGLLGIKWLAGLAVVANFANSVRASEGEDFLDKIFDAAEKTATNPMLITSAAVMWGADRALRNKDFTKYFKMNPKEKANLRAFYKLDNIGTRIGSHEDFKKFLARPAEWQALAHPNMKAEKIKGLLKSVSKRKPKPHITRRDLENIIPEKSITDNLYQSNLSPRARYLFYKEFFSARTKPNVGQIKGVLTGDSTIA